MAGKGFLQKGVLGIASTLLLLLAMSSFAHAQTFTVSSLGGSGSGSLGEAIGAANIADGQDQIVFQSGLSGTIEMTGDLPQITSPLIITGPGKDVIQVDGGDEFHMITSFQPVEISGLSFLNGSGTVGGAISAFDGLELDDMRISGGAGAAFGGAIYSDGNGPLVLRNCLIVGNDAESGGGVFASDADVTITNSLFSQNRATDESRGGGGINVVDSNLTVTGSEFTLNGALERGGGGILARAGDSVESHVTISDSTFTGNTANSEANLFKAGGGGVSIDATSTTITDSEFSGNSSNKQMGGLLISGDSSISGTLIADNEAEGVAGIMLGDSFPAPPPVCSIEDSTITGNTAQYTFGAIKSNCSKLSIESTTIAGNEVTTPIGNSDGTGGIYQVNGAVELRNSILSGNLPNDYTVDEDPESIDPIIPGVMTASFSLIGESAEGLFTEDVVSSNITSTSPMLGQLADNGGPLRTMLPATDSPVVDKGLSARPGDQRGKTRTFDVADIANAAGGNGTDMGAVELQPDEFTPPDPPDPPDPPVPSNRFSFGSVKLNRTSGVGSLRMKVPGKGRLLVVGSKTVARFATTARGKSTIVVKVKAKGRALKTLRKKGKVKVRATVRFTPTGGSSRTASRNVKLVKTKKQRR